MINELIGRVFVTRDLAHRAHWSTSSFSQHMALGEFYEKIIEDIDGIVEATQGFSGLVTPDILPGADAENLVDWLKSEADWIETNRDVICMGSNAIANLVDCLVGHYLTTVYKLNELK